MFDFMWFFEQREKTGKKPHLWIWYVGRAEEEEEKASLVF